MGLRDDAQSFFMDYSWEILGEREQGLLEWEETHAEREYTVCEREETQAQWEETDLKRNKTCKSPSC